MYIVLDCKREFCSVEVLVARWLVENNRMPSPSMF
jgi:hypothetical protein